MSTPASPDDGDAKPSSPNNESHRGLRGYACVPCAKRKVRCDRQEPCSNCRRRPNDHCHYLAPHPRRRHPRPSDTSAALARLQHLEQIVKELGVNPEPAKNTPVEQRPLPVAGTSISATPSKTSLYPDPPDYGRLKRSVSAERKVSGAFHHAPGDMAKSKYTEDATWTRLNQELPGHEHEFQEASDDEDMESHPSHAFRPPGPDSLLVGSSKRNIQHIHQLHPAPHEVVALWRKYIENVHPIVQLYSPTQKEAVIMRTLNNMDSVRLRTSLFLFTFYFSAIHSMSEADCRQIMNESKDVLSDKYQYAVEHLLAAVKIFRTSDFVALQAFVHYLLVMRARADMNTLWTLTGIALRLGYRIGLHRDPAALGCNPWEAELRRRTWWHMLHLEHRAAQLSGGPATTAEEEWDTKVPVNINDEDLYPSMTGRPQERNGSTDMMHVLCRFELAEFIRTFKRPDGRRWGFEWLMTPIIPTEDKDRALDRLEEHMQAKYLQFCDALQPLHFMTTITIRAALNSMRLSAHHPRHQSGTLTDFPQKERDLLFDLGMKSMQYDTMAHQQKIIQGFRWHFDAYFQWTGMIILLIELRTRTSGAMVDRAWDILKDIFEIHPNFISDSKKSLHAAVQALVLKAWAAREQYWRGQPQFFASVQPPTFISAIKVQREQDRLSRRAAKQMGARGVDANVDPAMALMSQQAGRAAGHTQPNHQHQAQSQTQPQHQSQTSYMGMGASAPITSPTIPQNHQLPAQTQSMPTPPSYFPSQAPTQVSQPQRMGSTGTVFDDNMSSGDSTLSFSPMDWAQWETLISEDMQQAWGPDLMDVAVGDMGYQHGDVNLQW